MTTRLFTENAWTEIKKAVRKTLRPSDVAVAYIGVGGSQILPLKRGSRLVVDASEGAVKSGQTCPEELTKLQRKGVRIFSVSNLHAKVFVIGNKAFIGSTNVSRRSSSTLVEALLCTTDPAAVQAARAFVREMCTVELGPEALQHLQKQYRPPKMPGGKKVASKPRKRGPRPKLPRVFLIHTHFREFPEEFRSDFETGLETAKGRRQHKQGFELNDFWEFGETKYKFGDTLVVSDEGRGGGRLFNPLANVIYTRTKVRGGKKVSFVFYEVPDRRRIRLETLARRLGRGAKKKLNGSGMIRNREFRERLLGLLKS